MLCPPRCPGADRRCRCGIYAFRSEQRALGEAPPPSHWHSLWGDYTVLGEVALWGKVVEHEHGYRAEHAMVQRLLVPTRLVIHVSVATFDCFGQLGDDEEGISSETMEQTPAGTGSRCRSQAEELSIAKHPRLGESSSLSCLPPRSQPSSPPK